MKVVTGQLPGWVDNRANNNPADMLAVANSDKCTSCNCSGAQPAPMKTSSSTQTGEGDQRLKIKITVGARSTTGWEGNPCGNERETSIEGDVETESDDQERGREMKIKTQVFYNARFANWGTMPRSTEKELGKRPSSETRRPPNNKSKEQEVAKVEVKVHFPFSKTDCEVDGCRDVYDTFGALRNHLKKRHRVRKVLGKCRKCGREGEAHSVACHAGKCKERLAQVEVKNFVCEVCQMSFATKIGLGQHERHRHANLRNEKRVTENLSKEKKGRKGSVWTEEETEKLIELNERFRGAKWINVEIGKFLTTKTNKQISDKRRLLIKASVGTDPVEEQVGPVRPIQEPVAEIPTDEDQPEQRFKKTKRVIPGQTTEDILESLESAEKLLGNVRKEEFEKGVGLLEGVSELVLNKYSRKRRGNEIRRRKINRQEEQRPNGGNTRRAGGKKAAYKAAQILFQKDRRRLARQIMGAPGPGQCELTTEEVFNRFKEKLGVANNKANLRGMVDHMDEFNYMELMMVIDRDEVQMALDGIKKDTAAGPDGIKKEDLERLVDESEELLPRLFSLWLKAGTIPECLKRSRTVLIPKTEDVNELRNLDNWRPITIGPLLLRLFTKIMAKRLSRAVVISKRQKGFLEKTPGCNENITILRNIISGSKRQKKDLAVVFVDLAKAFDSVGHKLIQKSLQRVGAPLRFRRLVEDLYTDTTTVVEVGESKTDKISVLKGVKQGDPMSPVLFNIALDPLISTLEGRGRGVEVEAGVRCTALAFADDIALLSDSYEGMAENLQILNTFCKNTGLEVNVKKTKGFYSEYKNKTFLYNTRKRWNLEGREIQFIAPGEIEKYLGAKIDPWCGVQDGGWTNKLETWFQGLKAAKLKPLQKIELMRTFMIPRIYYHLTLVEASQNILRELDRLIRTTAKEILHLPNDTTDGILYSRIRDGGLCLPKLEIQIPVAVIRKRLALELSEDRVIKASFGMANEDNQLRIQSLANLKAIKDVRGDGDLNIEAYLGEGPVMLDSFLEGEMMMVEEGEGTAPKFELDWRAAEFAKWARLAQQGSGIKEFKGNEFSNWWLRNHEGWKAYQIVDALLLRCGQYPTRCTRNKGEDRRIKTCRRCGVANETLAHISGRCGAVKRSRIKRHNKVMDKLKEKVCRSGWKAFVEPHIRTEDGSLWKPDLIFVKGGRAAVVDVSIRYEDNHNALERGWREKAIKYRHLTRQIQDLTGAGSVVYFGFVVGARGLWTKKNEELLQFIGGRGFKSFARNICSLTIRLTIDVLQTFMDG